MTGRTDATAAALELYDLGLAVVPAVGDDGKSVAGVVQGIQRWRTRLPRSKVEALFRKHPGACIALLVGHAGLVVVDCDDDTALAVAERRFGHTPILVRTPSGRGGHLYYRAPEQPVAAANLRKSDGLEIDIKAGKGAYVIAPPSVRPSSGVAYTFERGSWADVPSLPVFHDMAKGSARSRPASGEVAEEGGRNAHLFRRALELARHCETQGELEIKVHAVNEAECEPPVPWEEAERVAMSAWRYQIEGRNRVGLGRYVQVPEVRLKQMLGKPDALALDTKMRLIHEGLRDRFAASPKAMALAGVMPGWTAARYRKAIRFLVESGVWLVLKKGGRGAGDPHEYGFADRSLAAGKGTKSRPNTNKTPLPSLSHSIGFVLDTRACGMSDVVSFNANQRLAEVALWTDAGARWIEQAAAQGRTGRRGGEVTVTFDEAELETFVSGMRGVARALLGLAQPVPPLVPARPERRQPRLHVVSEPTLP